MVSYYENILQDPYPDRSEAIGRITRRIPSPVSKEHNLALLHLFTLEEMDSAIKEIPTGKSLGPNGFTTYFFHYCWPLVREEVWQIMEDSRRSGQVLSDFQCHIYHTHSKGGKGHTPQIVEVDSSLQCHLQNPYQGNFPSIKPILPHIISPEQSGYVEG
jgi:hypothetical protein